MGADHGDNAHGISKAPLIVNSPRKRPSIQGEKAMATQTTYPNEALVDRIRALRSALPVLAAEAAEARREAARLRRENAALHTRLEALQDPAASEGVAMPLTPPAAPVTTPHVPRPRLRLYGGMR
jgi:hypothetical protein